MRKRDARGLRGGGEAALADAHQHVLALVKVLVAVVSALVAVANCLKLPEGMPLALFALGRIAGWVAHAIEQFEDGQLIRPRAEYTGINPGITE